MPGAENPRTDAADKDAEPPGDGNVFPNSSSSNEEDHESTLTFQDPNKEETVVKGGQVSFQPRSQTTRYGRVTKVPAKFKE